MTHESKTDNPTSPQQTVREKLTNSYYGLLGLNPWASEIEIRRTYRQLSKLYHPDTTNLPPEIAKAKFQQINEAYGTLSNPERRLLYDYKIGYYRVNVIQAQNQSEKTNLSSQQSWSNSAYLDPTDRPLSTGEIFALFILGVTFIGCLLLAIVIGLTRENGAFVVPHTSDNHQLPIEQVITYQTPDLIPLKFTL